MTAPSLWVLRDPAGEMQGASVNDPHEARVDGARLTPAAIHEGLLHAEEANPEATSYTHDGWTLALEPHPTPDRGAPARWTFPDGLQAETRYEVPSDMDPAARMVGLIQEDGDVCLAIINPEGVMLDVEYCTASHGGGRFPLVHAAARELVNAIRLTAETERGA